METNELELQTLQESKRIYDQWVTDVHHAMTSPLTLDDEGKILTGCYWLPPIPPMYPSSDNNLQVEPPKRKRVTFKDKLRAWALDNATKQYDYEG